jgi:hypothetical protein
LQAAGVAAGPAVGPDTLHTVAKIELRPGGTAQPFLWTVRARADSATGWTTAIIAGSATQIPVPVGGRDVVVTALDRLGNESAAARLTLPVPAP